MTVRRSEPHGRHSRDKASACHAAAVYPFMASLAMKGKPSPVASTLAACGGSSYDALTQGGTTQAPGVLSPSSAPWALLP